MAMKNKTRRALVLSVLSLILCCSMLVGTTFAWFTDSATGKNVIKSGNLDVSLWHSPCTNTDWGFGFPYGETGEEVKANTKLFLNLDGEEILWEPGVQATDTFRVQNDGSLALKYELRFKAYNASKTDAGHDLTEVVTISAAELETPEVGAPFTPANGYYDGPGKLLDTNGDVYTIKGSLLPGQSIDYWVMAEWIPTNHDNDYNVENGLTLDLCVELVATQFTYEKDSYNSDQYDKNASLPIATPIIPEEGTVYEGNVIPNGMKNVAAWNGDTLQGDASIILNESFSTVILENVSGNMSGDAIITNADNTIVLYNCNFTLPEGAKLIKAGENGAKAGQVMMCNVTVNGQVLKGHASDLAHLIDCSGYVEAITE